MHDGSCLCGAVQVAVTVELPPVIACHCTACRKQRGHHGAFVELPRSALSVSGEAHVRWHRSSEKVRRCWPMRYRMASLSPVRLWP